MADNPTGSKEKTHKRGKTLVGSADTSLPDKIRGKLRRQIPTSPIIDADLENTSSEEEILTSKDQKLLKHFQEIDGENVPNDWKEQLDKIPDLEEQIKNLKESLKKNEEDNKSLQEDLDKKLDDLVYARSNIKDLENTKKDYEELIAKKEEWIKQIDDLKHKKDIVDSELSRRANISQADWDTKLLKITKLNEKLSFSQNRLEETLEKLNNRPNISIVDWVNDFQQRPTKKEFEDVSQKLENWETTFKDKDAKDITKQIDSLVYENKKWTDIFEEQTPKQIKDKIEELEERPDIPITKELWETDYKNRKPIDEAEDNRTELELEKINNELSELKQDLKKELSIVKFDNWKEKLEELKKVRAIENKLKRILDVSQQDDLPTNWISQIASRSQLNSLQNSLDRKSKDLERWLMTFPNKTATEVAIEKKSLESIKSRYLTIKSEKEDFEVRFKALQNTRKYKINRKEQELRNRVNKAVTELDKAISERDSRPSITHEEYQELLNNQKPTDWNENWWEDKKKAEAELDRIKKIVKRPHFKSSRIK